MWGFERLREPPSGRTSRRKGRGFRSSLGVALRALAHRARRGRVRLCRSEGPAATCAAGRPPRPRGANPSVLRERDEAQDARGSLPHSRPSPVWAQNGPRSSGGRVARAGVVESGPDSRSLTFVGGVESTATGEETGATFFDMT